MKRKTTLIVLGKDTSDTSVIATAEAAREQEAYLTCMLLYNLPSRPYFAYGKTAFSTSAMPADWVDRLAESNSAAETRAGEINGLLARNGCPGDVQYAVCAGAEIRQLCTQRAMSCDIAQFAEGFREDNDVFRDALHGLLFRSPIGVIVNGSSFNRYNRIFLAWDSSLAASRAAHAALPYLLSAQDVVIGCFDPDMSDRQYCEDPGTDVAAWLSHHGCNVTVSQFPSGGRDVGCDIQERAGEAGAELVVMGAYGHSRVREAVFGGTTRTMIEQTRLPVLFAH